MSFLVNESAISEKRNVIMLTLTEKCNLKCVYCFEKAKDLRQMSIATAQKAINEAFNNEQFEELEISFHGGEPLIAFEELKHICEWIWSNTWPKPYVCYATTNGTLVHGAIKDWVAQQHTRFVLGLSLDGTREMHNLNRSGSYDLIDLDLFRDLWPFQPVKMTISRLTLPHLSRGVIDLHNLGFKISCNHAHGLEWQDKDYESFATELKTLNEFYLEHPDVLPCNIAAMPIQYLYLNEESRRIKWCGAGTNMACIDIDGNKYPCQLFMPSASGSQPSSEDAFKSFQKKDLLEGECTECVIAPCCRTCYGTNYIEYGDIAKRNRDYCRFEKIRAKSTAYLVANMILGHQQRYAYLKDRTEMEIVNMINAIRAITERIQL